MSCPWRQPGQRVGGTPLGPKSRVWQVHARDRDLQGERSALEHSRLARPSHLHMLTHTCLAHAYRQFLNHQSPSHGNWVVTSWVLLLPATHYLCALCFRVRERHTCNAPILDDILSTFMVSRDPLPTHIGRLIRCQRLLGCSRSSACAHTFCITHFL